MSQDEVLFTGAYTYRKRAVLFVSVLLLMICIPLSIAFLVELFSASLTWERVGTALDFVFGIVGLLGTCGAWLFHAYFTHKVLALVVTTEGVTYGGRHFPWDDVGSLSGRYEGETIQLLLHRRGRGLVVDRHLPIDQGLTPGQFETLMAQLQDRVASVHNHLEFT